jgi:competence protein ComEC
VQLVEAPVLRSPVFYKMVEGRIEDIQDKAKGGQRLVMSEVIIEGMDAGQTPRRISISLRKPAPELVIGDKVAGKAMLFPPPEPSLPGGYDYARQAYFERIGAVGFAPSAPALVERAPVSRFSIWLNALRFSLAERIAAPMQPENAPIAAALMVGEMTAVPQDVADAMRDAGIYHVLSISGLHMSIAAALVYVSVRFLLSLFPPISMRLPTKKIAAVVGLASSFAYLLLAGHPVPAIRSFVMVACVMVAIMFDRRGISLYSLAWSAALILLFQPEALLGASFQLSYAATLFIVALYERYAGLLAASERGIGQRLLMYFWGLMLTSLVASLATSPLVIYHFNRFTLWGVVTNMLMMPLASFWIMPAAVLSFLSMPFGWERYPLEWLDTGIGLMVAGAKWVAAMPLASITVPPPTFYGVMLIVLGGLWLCIWQTRWRFWGAALMVLGMATSFFYQPYDLYVNDDASKVALRMEDGTLLFLKGRAESYDAQSWLRTSEESQDEDKRYCNRTRCDITVYGKKIVVLRKKKKRDELVENVCLPHKGKVPDIVISAEYMDRITACKKVPLLIERAYLQSSGSVGIRFSGEEVRVDRASDSRGERLWSR